MHRIAVTSGLVVAAACAPGPPKGSTPLAPDVVQLSGISLPAHAAGLEAGSIGRTKGSDGAVMIYYFPSSGTAPGVILRIPLAADSTSGTALRDALEAQLQGSLSSPVGAARTEVSAVEPIEVVGSDGISYNGWWGTTRVTDSRLYQWLYVFQKQGRRVEYYIEDDGLNPVVSESFSRGFISVTLGGLGIALGTSF